MKFLQRTTRAIKVSCFLLAVMVTCLTLQQYFLRNVDHNSLRIEGFYQEDHNSLDVVIIGASDIYTSFMPGRAYEQYGFTSYLFASESITAEGIKTAVKEVVRTQHPGMIVIEANAFLYGDASNESDQAHIHKFFDNIPLTTNKLEFIQNHVPADQRMEYIFPLIKYHSLWTEYPGRLNMVASNLTLDIRGHNYLKGFRTTAQIAKLARPCLNAKIAKEKDTLELDPDLEKQLLDLLDYCDQKNLNVVFVRSPHYVTSETHNRVKRSNRMAQICNERGFSYYAIENEAVNIGIDEKRDFYNDDHMNVYGAIKFTDYLAEKLVNEEALSIDPLSETQKSEWKEVAETTNQLYRYCDDMMKKGNTSGAQEDVKTLFVLDDYSGAPIKRQ